MAAAASPWRRPWAALEAEDLVLALGLLVLGPLLAPWLAPERLATADGGLSLPAWLAIAGLVAVFLTRGPADVDLDAALLRRMFVVGPLIFLFSIGAAIVNTIRRNPDRWPFPSLSLTPRRLLVLPYEILGEGAFRAFVPQEVALWSRGADAPFDPFFASLTLAMLFVGYSVLVMGPRLVAGAVADARVWTLRFLFYLAAAWLSTSLR